MSNNDSENPSALWVIGKPHEAVKPIEWLIGKWKSLAGEGTFPTIAPFTYCEEITFSSYGQPLLNYSSLSWHPVKRCPMHLESGFLRVQPGTNNLAFMVAHNFGLSTIEEGECINGNSIKLTSTNISRMKFAKEPAVTKVDRSFELQDDKLIVTIAMQTANTEKCQHLKAVYRKVQ